MNQQVEIRDKLLKKAISVVQNLKNKIYIQFL